MGMMQRRKGATAEREVAGLIRDLTGWDAQRRVRQHDGDSDLLGVPGWSIEVKRHAKATPSVIEGWWDQTVSQAGTMLPVLMYRLDHREWRAVWPIAMHLAEQRADYWSAYAWTAESSLEAWAAVAREVNPRKAQPTPPMLEAA